MLCLVTVLCWPVAAEQRLSVMTSAQQRRALTNPILQAEMPSDPPQSQTASLANPSAWPVSLPSVVMQTQDLGLSRVLCSAFGFKEDALRPEVT